MYKHIGYVWPGMKRIDAETAKSILKKGGAVYELHNNNSEAEVSDLSDFDPDGTYGIEFRDGFTIENYLKSNVDETGFVCFSHGTNDLDDLLFLALELFEVSKISVGIGIRSSMDDLEIGIRAMLNCDDEKDKWKMWRTVSVFISDITPNGWIFGRYRNNGLDYGFVKK